MTTTSSPSWPTPVGANDRTATSVELMESGQPGLIRQGLYQVQAAKMLMERGYDVNAVQQPLIGSKARLTLPILIVRPGPDMCAYTQCEPWTPERIGALQAWLRDLRQETQCDVIVVSREKSDVVAALPGVTEFIHMPDDKLPSPA